MILSPSQEEAKTKISKFLNSYDISNIKETIKNNMGSSKLSKISEKNYHLSHSYTWQKNVEETLNFFKLNIDDTKNIN